MFAMFVMALHSRAALYEDIEKPLPIIVYELWNVFTRYMPQSSDVNKHIYSPTHKTRQIYARSGGTSGRCGGELLITCYCYEIS